MIEIYGYSDDLIVVCGNLRAEIYANYNEDTLLELSNGAIVQVVYDGEWHFSVEEGADMEYEILEDSGRYNNYTEVLQIKSQIRSVEKYE